jgi:hypothetical protein
VILKISLEKVRFGKIRTATKNKRKSFSKLKRRKTHQVGVYCY